MGAFSVEVAAMVVDAAVIQRAEAHEAVLQGVVPLLVHVVVPDYILLTGKPLQEWRGENVRQQVGVYLNQSQNQQQVTLSLRKQLQHAGANWQVGKAVHTATERAGMPLNMTGSVLIYLLCILKVVPCPNVATTATGLSEHGRSFLTEHNVRFTHTHRPYNMFSLPPKWYFFFN